MGVPPSNSGVSASDLYVYPLKNMTDVLSLDKSTRVRWIQSTGDWYDSTGTLNGTSATITATGSPATVSITAIPRTIMIHGVGSVSNVVIDGVDITTQCFWTDPTSNGSLSLPSSNSRPVIVPNAGGSSMQITSNVGGGSYKIDPCALPTVPALPCIGPTYTAPSIYRVECSSASSIWNTVPGVQFAGGQAQYVLTPPEPEFLSEGGFSYIRIANRSTDYFPRLINWLYPLPDLEEVYCGYALYIEDDVWDSMAELGVKLSGPGGSGSGDPVGFHLIGEHSASWYAFGSYSKNPLNRTAIGMDYYKREVATGGGNPTGNPRGTRDALMRTGHWYWHEVYMKLNTPGLSDGIGRMWLNGTLIVDEAVEWRVDATSKIKTYQVQLYHGGLANWLGACHYRLGALCASANYIGPPPELRTLIDASWPSSPPPPEEYPVWRAGLPVNTFASIASTSSMNSTTANSGTINAWNGLAAGDHTWYSALNGGHADSSENKVIKIDLSADAPAWTVLNAGSPVPGAFDDSYYPDGKPASRHTYYTAHVIEARNRIMTFTATALYGTGSAGNAHVDGYNLGTDTWDSAGTFTDAPFFSPVNVVAKDPRNENIYLGASSGRWAKWTQATATWSTLSIPGFPSWEFKGGMVDGTRDRLVQMNGTLKFIDLTTLTASTLAVTGPLNGLSTAYWSIVHDLDNDRYLVVDGTNIYSINPVTGVSAAVTTCLAATNGVNGRLAYFQELGGVAYLPYFTANVQFMPTR